MKTEEIEQIENLVRRIYVDENYYHFDADLEDKIMLEKIVDQKVLYYIKLGISFKEIKKKLIKEINNKYKQ